MNEQQQEAIEKAARVFPRGLVAFTIAPNGALMIAQTDSNERISEDDTKALEYLKQIVIKQCKENSE